MMRLDAHYHTFAAIMRVCVISIVFCGTFMLWHSHDIVVRHNRMAKHMKIKDQNSSLLPGKPVPDLSEKLLKWRRQAGELTCKIPSNSLGVGPTGGWCLEPMDATASQNWNGCRPAKNHLPADGGIGRCKRRPSGSM